MDNHWYNFCNFISTNNNPYLITMKKLLIILAISALFLGCEKSTYPDTPMLIGKWSWISTCTGKVVDCSTPETTKQNVEIVFTHDSIYKYYINNQLQYSTKFHTKPKTGYYPTNSNSEYEITWESYGASAFSIIDNILSIGFGDFTVPTISSYRRLN